MNLYSSLINYSIRSCYTYKIFKSNSHSCLFISTSAVFCEKKKKKNLANRIRTSDLRMSTNLSIYSPPLYQLSYREFVQYCTFREVFSIEHKIRCTLFFKVLFYFAFLYFYYYYYYLFIVIPFGYID